MWRRKTTGVIVLALGLVLFIAGIADHTFIASKADLCQSDIGQIGQAIDNTVAHDCGLVTGLESAVGWLLVAGILTAVFGAAVLYNARTYNARTYNANSQTATPPRPAASPMPPAPAAPQPAKPDDPSADRPWWTQT